MKFKLYFFIISLISLMSCKTEVFNDRPFFNFETERITLKSSSYDTLLHVTTNITSWMANSIEETDWVKFERTYSGGEQYIRMYVSENRNNETRSANIIIAGESITDIPFEVVQHGQDASIITDKDLLTLPKDEGIAELLISSNIPVEYNSEEGVEWFTISETENSENKILSIAYDANISLSERSSTIKIFPKDQNVDLDTVFIQINQKGSDISDLLPQEDIKLNVLSATLFRGNVYGKQTVDKTIDGDYSTNYSGRKITKPDSVIIDYTLEQNIEQVNYIKLSQRLDQNEESIFSKGSVWYKRASDLDWVFKSNFEVPAGDNVIAHINIEKPEQIRICLQRSPLGNIALAEFECFKKNSDLSDIENASVYFTDKSYSTLKSGVTYNDIKNIKSPIIASLALDLLNKKYDKDFRVRTYNAVMNPIEEGKKLTIGSRSQCENPTGIFFEANKRIIVFCESSSTKNTTLYIKDFRDGGNNEKIALEPGINFITPKTDGNGYIQYWKGKDEATTPVKIHFLYGNEVGFWDIRNGDNDKTWGELLFKAEQLQQDKLISNLMIDVLGDKVQLSNTVNAFKTYASANISEIMSLHDQLINWEYKLMGLEKNNAIPQNRILGVRSWSGSPNWNGFSANFPNAEDKMLSKEQFLSNLWLFAHEFGHGNQVAQMKGAGWAEVTNNLLGSYVQYQMCDRTKLRLEHEEFKHPSGHNKIIGDRFNYYLDEALINKTLYLQQGGGLNEDGAYSADPFVSLVPLWQLTLFFVLNENSDWHRPDFWADVHWGAINDNKPNYSYGKRYTNFMKRAIEASGYNLSSFFQKMGLLKVSNRMIGDYGSAKRVQITQAMVDEVIQTGASKTSLENVAIEYISANSLAIFKDKKDIEGTLNKGISDVEGGKLISSETWKNVVAYETYEGDKLIHVSIFGTGCNNNSSTFVKFPEKATRIVAISWNTQRETVYQK